jgi:SAM-dependent methyltransferase
MLALITQFSRLLSRGRAPSPPAPPPKTGLDAAVDIDYSAAYSTADLNHDYWTVTGPGTREEYDRLSKVKLQLLVDLGLQPHHRLLDVGCGTGQVAQACEGYLSDAGRFFGTDVGESGIEFCRRRFRRPNFEFAVNPPTTLPIHGRTFDAACFFSVFTHTYPDETVLLLAETARLLDARGWIFADLFTTPSVDRYRGNRGAMIVNRDHFLRLAAVAGFPAYEVVMSQDCEPGVRREFFRMRRTSS